MSKRIRRVYPTDEVPHLWFHQTEEGGIAEARNPQRNLYFEGATIYSYGSHFPMATITKDIHGETVVLLSNRGYSSTTGRHMNEVRRAIPGNVPVFEVPLMNRRTNEDYMNWFKDEISKGTDALFAPGIRATTRIRMVADILSWVKNANEFGEAFGLKPRIEWPPEKIRNARGRITRWKAEADDWEAREADRHLALSLAADRARAKDALEYKHRSRKQEIENLREQRAHERWLAEPGILERVREGQTIEALENERRQREWGDRQYRYQYGDAAPPIAPNETDEQRRARYEQIAVNWMNGQGSTYPRTNISDTQTRLRIARNDNSTVETSNGARFPLADGLRILPLSDEAARTSTPYEPHGERIGHYPLTRIDEHGNATAGCHFITREEMLRFASTLPNPIQTQAAS